jgi:hypothetical protein
MLELRRQESSFEYAACQGEGLTTNYDTKHESKNVRLRTSGTRYSSALDAGW